MGNHVSRAMAGCFVPAQNPKHHNYTYNSTSYPANALFFDNEPYDEGLGHSFCYIRPSLNNGSDVSQFSGYVSGSLGSSVSGSSGTISMSSSSSISPNESQSSPKKTQTRSETTFKAISGASVSANASTPCSIAINSQLNAAFSDDQYRAAAFECTESFSSLPLQPIPKVASCSSFHSGPISASDNYNKGIIVSGPLERGFMSGPLERGCVSMSGPIDSSAFDRSQYFSAPLPAPHSSRRRVSSIIGAVSKPMKKALHGSSKQRKHHRKRDSGLPQFEYTKECSSEHNLQWAHGKAGEDRVHVVLSDKHGWLFVGIYDGFNGPDAPDFLMANLYAAIYKELQGLLWDRSCDCFDASKENCSMGQSPVSNVDGRGQFNRNKPDSCLVKGAMSNGKIDSRCPKPVYKRGISFPSSHLASNKDNHVHPQRSDDSGTVLGDRACKTCKQNDVDHSAVLKALECALEATEKAYLDMADKALKQNPELALMGSCILVMLMKDEDVYIMNVGDSRAIVAQHRNGAGLHNSQSFPGLALIQNNAIVDIVERSRDRNMMLQQDLARVIQEDSTLHLETFRAPLSNSVFPATNLTLDALQLSNDHSTNIEEEVTRIRAEHPDDEYSIVNDRVKGTLKVTRAFGAGFLKQPQWNNAILEMFRIDYVGSDPYISCKPSLCHHRLQQDDRFIILSSDGLYQYLTNQEAVLHVEWFMERFPDGDPAQYLIEELLFRAAKKAGMDFHELLDIPQGERRKYHDDVSVMVISLQGRIWKCSS